MVETVAAENGSRDCGKDDNSYSFDGKGDKKPGNV